MDKYIVSARKYRPNNFLSLIGQENIAVTLKNSIKRGQLAHAYLFCGPRGVGKTSTARIFAKTINCLNPSEDLEPCGKCESCLSFSEGRSYCIHELDAASNNSVDDIRLLTEQVRIPPQIGKYSVYIIDEVHMLSASAFNAFLKTLEEPPEHAIFILATTEKHKILPTILSRCQTYDFNRISIEDIVKNLTDISQKEEVKIDSESLHVIAQKADGAMRDALTLFDQCVAFCGNEIAYKDVIKNLNVLDYDYYFRLTDLFLKGDYASALMLFDEVLSKGFNALYFVGGLSTHLRNLMVSKNQSTAKLLELSPMLIERYSAQAALCSLKFLFKGLEFSTMCEADYKVANNPRLLVEFMILKMSSLSAESQLNIAEPVAAQPKSVKAATPVVTPVAAANTAVGTATATTVASTVAATADTAAPAAGTIAKPAESMAEPASAEPAKSMGGLSIKSLLSKAGNTAPAKRPAPEAAVVEKAVENKPLEQSQVEAEWNKICKLPDNPPRLAAALGKMEPKVMEDGETIEITVENATQKIWMEKNKIFYYTSVLQKNLSNLKIKLYIKIREVSKQENKLYMPQEKAKYMLENNPELAQLSKDLDLEIK